MSISEFCGNFLKLSQVNIRGTQCENQEYNGNVFSNSQSECNELFVVKFDDTAKLSQVIYHMASCLTSQVKKKELGELRGVKTSQAKWNLLNT